MSVSVSVSERSAVVQVAMIFHCCSALSGGLPIICIISCHYSSCLRQTDGVGCRFFFRCLRTIASYLEQPSFAKFCTENIILRSSQFPRLPPRDNPEIREQAVDLHHFNLGRVANRFFVARNRTWFPNPRRRFASSTHGIPPALAH